MAGTRISGWGSALPEKVVTNADLEATLDTSDQWIVERTGIRERRIGGTTSGLAIEAGQAALSRAGSDGTDIDLVIVATCTPDQVMPATAATVQDALGVAGGAVDVNAVCSGFVYGLAGLDGEAGGGAADAALTDARALANPRVVRVDELLELGVASRHVRQKTAGSQNATAWGPRFRGREWLQCFRAPRRGRHSAAFLPVSRAFLPL